MDSDRRGTGAVLQRSTDADPRKLPANSAAPASATPGGPGVSHRTMARSKSEASQRGAGVFAFLDAGSVGA